jgi:hypothetical protein
MFLFSMSSRIAANALMCMPGSGLGGDEAPKPQKRPYQEKRLGGVWLSLGYIFSLFSDGLYFRQHSAYRLCVHSR